MRSLAASVVIFASIVIATECANILIVSTAPFPGHQAVGHLLANALVEREHNVTIITSDPLGLLAPVNVTEIDVGSLNEKYFAKLKPRVEFEVRKPSEWEEFTRKRLVADVYTEYADRIYTHANWKSFIKQEISFDACVVESDYPAVAGIAARYGCHLVVLSSQGWPGRYLSYFGDNSYAPTEVNKERSFVKKLVTSFQVLFEKVYYDAIVTPREDKIVKRNLNEDAPYLADIQKNASVLLVNRDPVIDPVLPLAPIIVDIGGIYTSRPKKHVHLGMHIHLNASKEQGAAIFNLGPYVKSTQLPKSKRETLIKGFEALEPLMVFWKWEKKTLPNHPKNVYITDWMSLFDALSYPEVKVFITGGDLNSIQEAVKQHVPIVGIPPSYEHAAVLEKYLAYGIGKSLSFENLTVELLNETVREVIDNPVYKENVIQLDEFLRDQPLNGLERAVWWTEYVIRNNGTLHLRDINSDIPLYQYYLLDVIGFVLLIASLAIYIPYKIIRFVVRKLRNFFGKRNTAKVSKSKKDK